MEKSNVSYRDYSLDIYYPVNVCDITIKNLKMGKLFNRKLLNIYEEFLEEGNNAIYVGAYLGTHAFIMKHIIGGGQMILFEPQPRIAKCLTETIVENDITGVEIVEKCVGCSNDTCDFFSTDNSRATMSFLAPRLHNRSILKKEVICIDDCIEGKIDFMKIDCEGSEFMVLEGALKVIKKYKPTIVISTDNIDTLHNWCAEFNYYYEKIVSSYFLLTK